MPNSNKNRSNRDSVADLENELYDLFDSHHLSKQTENGEPIVPASALLDVIHTFGEYHDGIQLLSEEEEIQVTMFVEANPDIDVTPTLLLNFLRALTQKAAAAAGAVSGGSNSGSGMETSSDDEVDGMLNESMRSEGDDEDRSGPSSRSSSQGRSKGMSSSVSLPPKTPSSAGFSDSPFDSSRRQRTAPLTHHGAAPSSWNAKRVPTHGRRRSDASNNGRAMSDTEFGTPSRPGSRSGHHRAPSNPGSARGSDNEEFDFPMGRSSRRTSHSVNYGGSISAGGRGRHSLDALMSISPDDRQRPRHRRRPSQSVVERAPRADSSSSSDEDDDGDDHTFAFIRDRNDSLASVATIEREEALQRSNQELSRRVVEQDRILQRKISEHEAELEQLEIALEETKSELSSSKREEKELRSKEMKYIHQIQTLESEVAKSQRALETAKAAYQSLQKQYQEQCTEAENLRNSLRQKEEQYRDAKDKIGLHSLEIDKWQQQQEHMDKFTHSLEQQLAVAHEAQIHLDEQKQENLLLKETIDRMRFDMDELRLKADGNVPSDATAKGQMSNQGSLSKSLGQELARMGGKWPGGEDSDEEDDSTAVSEDGSAGEGTEGEDVVQTIITRRKKKVASRAMKIETIRYEDTRTYSDAYTQHDVSEFMTSHQMQTEPEPERPMASSGMQTSLAPMISSTMQTEHPPSPPPVVKAEMQIQTDVLPVPKDLPPSYVESSQAAVVRGQADPEDEEDDSNNIRGSYANIRKWHRGLEVPLNPVAGGISEDAIEEWNALKQEMGFECLAIEKVIEMSLKTGRPRSSDASTSTDASTSRRSKFYNIYNTFVADKASRDLQTERDRSLGAGLTSAAMVVGACVLVAGLIVSTPGIQSQYDAYSYSVPSGPGYYDRAAWAEFNRLYPVGEGLVASGAASVWDVVGRITGGAARMARGWPT